MSFRISRYFLYSSVFAIALVTTSTLFPFIVGKYSWFRSAVDFSLIFFLFGMLSENSAEGDRYLKRLWSVLKSPLGIAVSAFTAMFLLACAFGVNPANSFWSNFERGEGGLQILHLYLFFLLLATLFDDEKNWKILFYCIFGAALLSIGYGILAGMKASNTIGPAFGEPSFRFQGSIGNPAYMATYLIFVLFYAFYAFFSERQKELKSPKSIFLLFLVLVFAAFLFLAATRGAFLGLMGSTLVFLCYVAFANKRWRKWLLGAAAVLILFVGSMIALKDNPTVKKLPFARVFDISISAQTFGDRMEIWKMAWDGFKERPLLGVGPENFLYVFDHNFNPAYFKPPAQFGAWFDRAHSIIFDYLAEIGILGALAFFSIFGVFYLEFFRKNRRAGNSDNPSRLSLLPPAARALVFALPVAYLVQGLVLFDILPTYLNLFIFFALAAYLFSPAPRQIKNHE
ncbi:MAG: O-antigen ligase family protein [Candidatus Liptonbacteria bacterium]|nr:O-antigen ligase family protein [Candidatus Liptonbacteria bacterium]